MVSRRFLHVMCIVFLSGVFTANVYSLHLQISDIRLEKIDTKAKTAIISFTVSWDKAWRNKINCDGVWVFAKYRTKNGLWKHVSLSSASRSRFNYHNAAPKGFSAGDNPFLGLWVPSTKKGMFVFRTKGSGDVVSKRAKMVWSYGEDGVKTYQVRNAEIKVFGLEMVYVPQGSHYVGDPDGKDGPTNCLYTYPDKGPYLISSEEPLRVDKAEGALYCDQDNLRSRDEIPFVIPREFPKGYKAFWCMKYELSSQQWVDFLNTLTRTQQQAHVASDISGDRIEHYYVMTDTDTEHLGNTIVCAKEGNGTKEPVKFYTYAPAKAVNYISWSDLTAYADWAGLRPITELEYEKACRGPVKPEGHDYPWGMTEPGRVQTFDGAFGSGYEKKVPQEGVVNCCFHGGIAPFEISAGKKIPDNPGFEGPVSIGLFENSQHEGVPKRINDGASYYGIMELSGNLWERCVTIGHSKGRAFKGTHGDGNLDPSGYADVPDWPGKDGAGAGNRGGVWSSPSGKYLWVALRFAANNPRSKKGKNSGIRLGF